MNWSGPGAMCNHRSFKTFHHKAFHYTLATFIGTFTTEGDWWSLENIKPTLSFISVTHSQLKKKKEKGKNICRCLAAQSGCQAFLGWLATRELCQWCWKNTGWVHVDPSQIGLYISDMGFQWLKKGDVPLSVLLYLAHLSVCWKCIQCQCNKAEYCGSQITQYSPL